MSSHADPEATRTLTALADGDPSAAERLMPLVYDELRSLARAYLRSQPKGHTLQPTALVHEAYLHLVDQTNARWQDRRHFLAVAAIAMRQLLIQHARRKGADKRGGAWRRLTLDDRVGVTPARDVDVLDLDEALQELAKLDQRQARIVELRFFGGLTVEEVADVAGVSKRTVESDWRVARAWLHARLVDGPP